MILVMTLFEKEAIMPLVQISLRRGKPAAYRQAVRDGVYRALREVYNVPENDRFILVTQHEAEDFDCDRSYLGIARSDDLIVIRMTVSNTRGTAEKQALYKRVVENLGAHPGVRPEDVFITLVEVLPENWSFGHGVAQYV
jgi:4-oxalocrotonate tautomerase